MAPRCALQEKLEGYIYGDNMYMITLGTLTYEGWKD